MKTAGLFLLLHLTNGQNMKKGLPKGLGKLTEPVNRIVLPKEEYAYPGPLFYEKYVEPATGLKEPVDIFEMMMVYPKTEEEKRYYLKNYPLRDIQFISKKKSKINHNPRKEIIANETRTEWPLLFDLEVLQSSNLNQISKPSEPTSYRKEEPMNVRKQNNEFTSFAFPQDDIENNNWTTCDEFKKNARFHPNDLLKIDWVPFYMWVARRFYGSAVVYKFKIPTIKDVQRYKKEYGPYLSEKVDWNQPKLLLLEEYETPMLLIAADQRGLYHGIQEETVPDYIKTHPEVKYPVIKLRMKIVDPYLAMMHCNELFAQIMAIKGQEPETDKLKEEEAKALNFTGIGQPVSKRAYLETESIHREEAESEKLQKQTEEVKFINYDYDFPKGKYFEKF